MLTFGIRFFICNIFIAFIIGIIVAARQLFRRQLSSRMRYQLWFVMLALLAVPFLPIKIPSFIQLFSHLVNLNVASVSVSNTVLPNESKLGYPYSDNWMNDFSLSVSNSASSHTEIILLSIWLLGIGAMIILIVKSRILLHRLKCSSLPLQNKEVRKLYANCLLEMGLHKKIPIYSTAFLKSPIIVGLFSPCIYLPIQLISDYSATDMRYMLLHELQHVKHNDALSNYLMILARTIYWFNPFIWYALKEMQNDRETACDTSVLEMLNETDYEDYGNTLINFAEKVSLIPFPFAAGIGGSMKQMKHRIINIASYEPPTLCKKMKSILAFSMTALLLFSLAPILSIYASEENHYAWETKDEIITGIDLAEYFEGYDGSFVLYDLENDSWNIYNRNLATKQSSPNSTYKIYDALLGLERGIISPTQSQMEWNRENYPFESWNKNQNLSSAMENSVNWYFQSIDSQIGLKNIQKYMEKINYGNQDIGGGISSYWMESSLKISPVEQVELLRNLYRNTFQFAPKNINAVKDSIRIASSSKGTLYGKTGTGRVDGKDVNGWFIGYVECPGHTYFFAANIKTPNLGAEIGATGSNASEIALAILSDFNIWNQ